MKKTVKSLIVAASVAAIAGIGAVSFAKWNASTNVNDVDVPGVGQTGTIVTMGSFTASGDLTGKTLMPWDQVDQLTATTQKVWTITIDETNLTDAKTLYNFTYSVKYNAVMKDDPDNEGQQIVDTAKDLGVNKLYVFTGTTYAAPTGSSLGSDWTALGNTAVEVKGTTIYIVLDSDNDSYATDHAKDFGVTISAVASEKTAA